MENLKVNLRPIINNINLPTVLKTTLLPGDTVERLFIVTQVGEIFYIRNGRLQLFLDIRPRILQLGVTSGGYDERGLLGLAFHPDFYYNGLFYLHYTLAGTQGPGVLTIPGKPNPCDPSTLNLKWIQRETQYDHIDTVEEWIYQSNGQPQKRRTLLTIRRPFSNHNGVNSLNISPETGKLILTTGDGGSGYDPFNLSQDDMEIAGKIIEIDINTSIDNPLIVTRFDELSADVQRTLTIIAKGVRNIPGISFQRFYNQYIKLVGNVGQDLVESIFSFIKYQPLPVVKLIQESFMNPVTEHNEIINLGWRGWEGALPTTILRGCSNNSNLDEIIIAYYDETIKTSLLRLQPLTSYYHKDSRADKFGATALTGVQSYMGTAIPYLTGSVVFTDLARNEDSPPPVRGVLACTKVSTECKLNDFYVIDTDYDFGNQSAYYVSLGTNQDQTKLFLGVYGSMKVADPNLGTIFEIIPF